MASLADLLDALRIGLESASEVLPEKESIVVQENGVSLLDTKNELMLAYLQNLVFFIILQLRKLSSISNLNGESDDINDKNDQETSAQVREKLIELRVYLEKGVRPLENKLKYQLDKLLSAAAEAEARKTAVSQVSKLHKSKPRHGSPHSQPSDSDSDNDNDNDTPAPAVSDLSYRPNPSALLRPHTQPTPPETEGEKSGVYKPPHITPTLPPTSSSTDPDARTRTQRQRPRKSATLENFISEELATAPLTESSIGARTAGLRGKERERDAERRAYEETRLVRLPSEKKGKRGRGDREGYGLGEDGRADLDINLDAAGLGSGSRELFKGAKGRKRKVEAGGYAKGMGIGENWDRRVKQVAKRRKKT